MLQQAFHGTNQNFIAFSQDKARLINDFYGGGVAYFTSKREVAEQYAKAMAKKYGGDQYIYTVRLTLKKTFDVDNEYSGQELAKMIKNDPEAFARSAGLLNYGVGADKYTIISDLKSGNMHVKGDQVFKGLSRGMVNTANARKMLQTMGYDSLRYNGGLNMGMATKHDVYIAYNASSIKIIGVRKNGKEFKH